MPYDGHPIPYRYKHLDLPNGNTLVCISIAPEDEAPLEHDSILWANLLANVLKKHSKGPTLGIFKIGDKTYIPQPVAGSMKVIQNTFVEVPNSGLADGESDWPQDSDTATR